MQQFPMNVAQADSLSTVEVEVKNTFIHFGQPAQVTRSSKSCPPGFAPSAVQPWRMLEQDKHRCPVACDSTTSTEFGSGSSSSGSWRADTADAEELLFEERLMAIGCRGCACRIPIVCEHALRGNCNKAKCRYCHCSVPNRKGSGEPVAKQSTRKYVERLLDGELNGKQYLTLLSYMLGGFAHVSSLPAWLTDEKEVQSIATCLVYAFTQRCKVSMARELLLRICTWVREEAPAYLKSAGLVHFFEQLQVAITNINLKGASWYVRSEELSALRSETLSEFQCRHLTTTNWPKKIEENGLSSAPWLGVFHTISKTFAWELYFHHPESQLFNMDNILGSIARDMRWKIQEKLQGAQIPASALVAIPSQSLAWSLQREAGNATSATVRFQQQGLPRQHMQAQGYSSMAYTQVTLVPVCSMAPCMHRR
mmetsp:Transcript_73508/g.137353  ORF Transcript_73508/g.137353 Transcript_73508/m.137353 type:complete len:424 (+) Transcript_73508:75-1346(+)